MNFSFKFRRLYEKTLVLLRHKILCSPDSDSFSTAGEQVYPRTLGRRLEILITDHKNQSGKNRITRRKNDEHDSLSTLGSDAQTAP